MRQFLARAARTLLLGAALAALPACAPAPNAPAQRTQEQIVEGITIALTHTDAPAMNATQELKVTLTDAQGARVEGADVYLDLIMPTMPMGTNRPIATPDRDGTYRVQTAFTMTGDWEVTVVATINGQERRATFTVAVPEA
jgi:nitrogen fixation protein FixH